jgi:predicted DCC family thiol-disulfide oxidoreductase YuxK
MSEKPVVFFDGYCKLCSGWVRFLMKNNGEEKFNFVALQSEEGQKTLKVLELSTVDLTTIIFGLSDVNPIVRNKN